MIALRGDSRALDGPSTRVARVILDADGEVIRHEDERVEYHRPTGWGAPVWVVEGADGSDILIVDDVDAKKSRLTRAHPEDLPVLDRPGHPRDRERYLLAVISGMGDMTVNERGRVIPLDPPLDKARL